jgi:hypothetical protein
VGFLPEEIVRTWLAALFDERPMQINSDSAFIREAERVKDLLCPAKSARIAPGTEASLLQYRCGTFC